MRSNINISHKNISHKGQLKGLKNALRNDLSNKLANHFIKESITTNRSLNSTLKAFSFSAVALASSFAAVASDNPAEIQYGNRYIVKFRNDHQFKTLDSAFKSSQKTFRTDMLGRSVPTTLSIPGSQALVLNTLPHTSMMIVGGTESQVLSLQNNPNIEYVEREMFYKLPPMPRRAIRSNKKSRTRRVSPKELTWGVKAINAPAAWKKIPAQNPILTDTVRVVVLDTGIDRDHPDLKNRHADGRNFVSTRPVIDSGPPPSFLLSSIGNLFFDTENENNEVPYPYFDHMGHGTHVSGTIAAELDGEGVVGVAPHAKIYSGRVCGKFGCSTVSIVEGINWAAEMRADVINMSLGGPIGSRAQLEALNNAENKGVISVAASGNSATNRVSFPAAFPSVISVGAINDELKKAVFSQWGPELDITAPGVNVHSTIPMGTGRASLVKVRMGTSFAEVTSNSFVGSAQPERPVTGDFVYAGLGKAEDFKEIDVKDKIALVKRGEITFADKTKNAIASGAKALVIFNNEAGLASGAITQDGSTMSIAVVMIEQLVGEQIVMALEDNNTVSTSIAIVSTNHSAMQGTSMASPHVAGVVALLRSVNAKLTTKEAREILKQTAAKPNDSAEAIEENQYGAGIVDAEKAIEMLLSTL